MRCAHLSPNTPAVDVYMYTFGSTADPVILRHVSDGNVSDYMPVKAGQYTLAMRAAGASASSSPVLSTSFSVTARKSCTVAGVGPASGLRLQVFSDDLTAPAGKTLVRVIQASLNEHQVTVSYGSDVLASKLAFGSATAYQPLVAGSGTVKFTSPGAEAAAPVDLDADSGRQPGRGVGWARHRLRRHRPRPVSSLPWLLTMAGGTLLALAGWASLRRTRGTRAGSAR